jgi:hypothetical protein
MNSKQSISVMLMLGLLSPLTACGEAKEGGEESSSPALIQPSAAPGAASATKEEGGEGGESGEGKEEKEKEEGGEGGEGT